VKDKIHTYVAHLAKPQILVTGIVILSVVYFLANLVIKKYQLEETLCLALNIYHEGRGEPQSGRYAIATVTLNRVASEKYPNNVCEVVYQRSYNRDLNRYIGVFSWTQDDITDTPMEHNAWKDAYEIARNAYHGEQREKELSDALFYHADHIQPYWIKHKKPVKIIGSHIFYN